MKILTPVLAALAAATLSLDAQTHTTTTQTTATAPSATMTTPSTTVTTQPNVTTPSTTVAPPAATATTPSVSVATPSVAAPSATVTTPPATVATPSATVDTSSTAVAAPPATVTTPGATVAEPSGTATETVTTPPANPPPGHPIAGYIAQEDKWIDAPPALSGAQMMVLHGDINKAGPYTIRLRFPAGYRLPLHWHDNEVNFTVISGILHIGIAPNFDSSNSKEIGAMSFATIPAKMKHTIWTDIETIVQVHGLGPWTMHEAYPAATVGVAP